MNLSGLINNLLKVIKSNGPEILTAFGALGVVTTAVYTAKATVNAVDLIEKEKEDYRRTGETSFGPVPPDRPEILTPLQTVKIVWPLYVPAVVSGVGSVACIIFASRGNSKRTAAAVTAYSVTEKAFAEYRDKVVKELGERKDKKILDAVAQDRVDTHPPPSNILILEGNKVLCCELHTGRYFQSDMETLKKTKNEINAKIMNQLYVTLDDFYYLLDIPVTSESNRLGWDSARLLDLQFSTVLSPNGTPCLAFDYNYVKPLK